MLIQTSIFKSLKDFSLESLGGVTPPWVGGVTLGGIRAIGWHYAFRYHNRRALCEIRDLCAYVIVSCLVLRVLTSV